MNVRVKVHRLFRGYIKMSDLLVNEGSFFIELDPQLFSKEETFWEIYDEASGFHFLYGIRDRNFYIKRNDCILEVDAGVIKKNCSIYLKWNYSEVSMQIAYNDRTNYVLKEKGSPALIPQSLVDLIRKRGLLDSNVFDSEEHFKESVFRSLNSIQQKILESNYLKEFWQFAYEGSKIISRTPKESAEVQPFIQAALSDQMLATSVQLKMGCKTESGRLDFLIKGKLSSGKSISMALMVKNAHSYALIDGLVRKLPTYMDEVGARLGAYLVLDYRCDWFNIPDRSRNGEFYTWLNHLKEQGQNPHANRTRIFNLDLGIKETMPELEMA